MCIVLSACTHETFYHCNKDHFYTERPTTNSTCSFFSGKCCQLRRRFRARNQPTYALVKRVPISGLQGHVWMFSLFTLVCQCTWKFWDNNLGSGCHRNKAFYSECWWNSQGTVPVILLLHCFTVTNINYVHSCVLLPNLGNHWIVTCWGFEAKNIPPQHFSSLVLSLHLGWCLLSV